MTLSEKKSCYMNYRSKVLCHTGTRLMQILVWIYGLAAITWTQGASDLVQRQHRICPTSVTVQTSDLFRNILPLPILQLAIQLMMNLTCRTIRVICATTWPSRTYRYRMNRTLTYSFYHLKEDYILCHHLCSLPTGTEAQ